MSRDKLIVIGLGVLGVLGFLVYKQAKTDESLGRPDLAAATFPTVSADDVDKVSIKNGEKSEIVLQKTGDTSGDAGAGGTWEIVQPVKAPANQQAVTDLVNNLKELKVDSKINLKLDDALKKDKQLDAEHAVHVVAWKGADKKIDESFGKSGTAGQLTVTADKPESVWAVKGYSSYLYTKETKDFRKKDILHFDDANVTQVTITNAHGTLSFTKGDSKWAGTLNGKALPRFDEDKVKDMLRAYKALNADDFGDGKSLADTGLDKPEATVAIHLKDGAGDETLQIGAVSGGSNHWAKKASDDTIYQVTSFVTDWATSDAPKYESAADAGAPKADAGKK